MHMQKMGLHHTRRFPEIDPPKTYMAYALEEVDSLNTGLSVWLARKREVLEVKLLRRFDDNTDYFRGQQ